MVKIKIYVLDGGFFKVTVIKARRTHPSEGDRKTASEMTPVVERS